MAAILLTASLAIASPTIATRDDKPFVAAAHGLSSLGLMTWAEATRRDGDRGLGPWITMVSELVIVPSIPRIDSGRWSSAIVWACVKIAAASAGKLVDILVGDRFPTPIFARTLAYGVPLTLAAVELATF